MKNQERHAAANRRLADAVLGSAGATSPDLRRAIEARAAVLGGGQRPESPPLPEPLAAWVEKVARHAYKTTDEDVEALKHAGYSEDEIFEATVATALGAGLARLERGLAALRGEDSHG